MLTIFKRSIILIFLLCFSFNHLVAQDGFEGKIKFKITSDDEEMFMDYFIKSDKLRMEMGEHNEAAFIHTGESSLVLMHEDKMYMDLDNSIFSKLPGMTDMEDESDENDPQEFDFEKFRTGKTKTILGYECEQWIFTDEEDEGEVEVWVTDELSDFMLMKSPMGAGYSPGWSNSVNNSGFFPMLVITRDDDNEVTSRFEATEVNKQSLDDDLFAPPSDYSEMKIPGMDSLFK
jgi:hypothetical protein